MIYTFYSYKGGVGRSMALANIAEWFYRQRLRVVIIDWDLEAPGLENFFYSAEKDLEIVRSQLGLIDLLMAYKRQFPRLPMPSNKCTGERRSEANEVGSTASALRLLQESLPPITDVLYPIHPPKSETGDGAALWLLPAGWRSGDRFPLYAQAVQSFDWTDFYASFDGELYFEWMRSQLVENNLADVVLIDSRTGVTEMGGVCTRQLADVVVSVCVPNVQNLVGIATMAKSFSRDDLVQKRGREIEMVVVPARIDVSELDARNFFEHQFRWLLDEFTPEAFKMVQSTFWDLAIQYIPKYAYSEQLAIGAPDSAKELEDAYKTIAAHLVVLAQGKSAIGIRKKFSGELQRVFGNRMPSLFITYVERDGALLAGQVRDLLREYELPLLPDFSDAKDKREAWREITGFIDQAKVMLMMLTPDALRSDSLRKQWRYARQQGVSVLLVRRQTAGSEIDLADLPRWMRNAPFFDLDESLDDLVRQIQNPPLATRVPFMAPDPPDNFVERPAEFQELRNLLLGAEQGAINVALWGPPGDGKTALAKAFCNDEDVITEYAGGILWVTLGVEPNIPGEIAKLCTALTGVSQTFLTEEEAATSLAEQLSDKNCLIVINDVWSSKHLQPFLTGGRSCARLITTSDLNIVTGIGAKRVTVGEMSTAQAIEMIAGDTQLSSEERPVLERFVESLGKSPLALRLANAALRNRIGLGDQPIKALHHLQHALDKHGVIAFDQADASERDQSVARSIAFSLEQLSSEKRERYIQLAFFPGDAEISLAEVSKLWGLAEFEAEEQVQRLGYLSLLTYDPERKSVSLNSVIRSYILNHMPVQAGLNTKLEAAFAHLSPEEQEGARRVCTRLVRLAQVEEVGKDTRLRIKIKDLGQAMMPLVDKLAKAQIIAIGQDPSSAEQTVELIDDSMIQYWDRLRNWIARDREFLLWRQQLQAAVAYWEEKGRNKSTLLTGPALKLAATRRKTRSGDLNDAEILYLNESERLGRKRRNRQAAVAAAIAVIVILVLGYAEIQKGRRAQETALKDSLEHINTGNDYLSKRKLDQAIEEFNLAASIKSDNSDAYYHLGLAYFQVREFDQAISNYEKAITLRSDFGDAYLHRGRAYRHRGDPDNAIADYDIAIRLLEPTETADTSELAKAYNFRGYAYFKKGDIARALEDCRKAIELNPKYADAYDSLGSIHLAKGDKSEIATAVDLFKQAVKLNPSYIVAYANLGKAYFLNNEVDAALEQLSDAIELFESLDQLPQRKDNYVEALYYRGRAYVYKGDRGKAIEDFSAAIRNNDKYIDAYLYRGMEYKHLAENDKAIADLSQVLSLSTNATQRDWASQNLEQLNKQPIVPRIIVRYADPGNKLRIDDISRNISQTMGYRVRAELRPEASFAGVRYYHAEDKENAERIRQTFMLLLSDSQLNLKVTDRTNRSSRIARGTIEVWLPSLSPEKQTASSADQSQSRLQPAKKKAGSKKL